MMKKAAFISAIVLLTGRVSAFGQELTSAPLAATLVQVRALKPAFSAPSAPAAVVAAPGTISYSGMAQSFDSAPAAPLASFLGDWLEIADASSPNEPGQYDPKGFPDWLYRTRGLEVTLIPAKPPIQDKDAFQVAWGGFSPKTAAFDGFAAAEILSSALGGVLDIPGHDEENPVTCGNCPDQGDTTHWVGDQIYEFHLVGAKSDFLIERVTSDGKFNAATRTVSGGTVSYVGFSKH
jgi:hypothetical protein